MGWSAPIAAPKCPACKAAVFPAESFMASDRTPFHKKCVKCRKCGKALNASTLNEHQTQLYCRPCYDIIFNLQSGGGDSYEGILTEEEKRRQEEQSRKQQEKSKRSKEERRCPACDMRTFTENSLDVSGWFYHRECLKCIECGRGPDSETPMMLGPKDSENVFEEEELQPYCKFCFAKRYKISALNVQETVTIV